MQKLPESQWHKKPHELVGIDGMHRKQALADILPRALRERLQALSKLAVAFSGGLDSRFLCHAASLCGCELLALHISGPHVPLRESEAARNWAERSNINFISLFLNPLEVEGLHNNGKERCYFCKKSAFGKIRDLVREKGLRNYQLCDGGNRDDRKEFRPGLRAVQELGFISPLGDVGLGKKEIRHYAKLSGLENPDQRARPCLLTRFPYGQAVSLERLARLERAESQIEEALSDFGAGNIDFRLRMTTEPELHINPVPPGLLKKIGQILANNIFANCHIIQTEKISGYYDQAQSKDEWK